MADIAKCKNSIGGLKGRVTYYNNLLESATEFSVGEYESMLDRIKNLYVKFDQAQSNLEDLEAIECDENARDEFETRCRSVEACVRNKLRDMNDKVVSLQSSDKPELKLSPVKHFSIPLPEIPLPRFDGFFLSWIEFREIYVQRIHIDRRLDSILKFSYLRECLKGGSAYHFIDGIPSSEQNYEQVWDSISKHYENEPRIRTLHMQLLFELKPVRRENNASDLRLFIDSFWKQFNALKALKAPVEHWDLFLVYHVSQLIDPASRHQVEIKRPVDRDLKLAEMMEILVGRSRVLEAMTSVKGSGSHSGVNKPQKPIQSCLSSGGNQISCLYCEANHSIYKCEKFVSLPWREKSQWVQNRKLCPNCFESHNITNCRSKFTCHKCKRKHNTLLHITGSGLDSRQTWDKSFATQAVVSGQNQSTGSFKVPADSVIPNSVSSNIVSNLSKLSPDLRSQKNSSIVASCIDPIGSFHSYTSQVLLSTVLVWVESSAGVRLPVRALLDSGSQSNFITENICQKLKAIKKSIFLPVSGINENITKVKYKVDLFVESRLQKYRTNLNFLVLPKITGDLPLQPVCFDVNKLPEFMELADPKFFTPSRVDMLLGAEIYSDIMIGEKVNVVEELPPFQATVFGYVICGKTKSKSHVQSVSLFCCSVDEVRKEVQQFYTIEDVKPRNNFSIEEKACENHYNAHVRRDVTGRYSVALPTKPSIVKLESNEESALKQFLRLEKRFALNPDLKDLYCQFIDDYISLKHMQRVQHPVNVPVYFLPHHAVMKETSTTTKLRVVFNGSSKSSSGLSLNDCLMTGPTIQTDLLSLILRFRKYPVAMTADITKMYRQINIHDSDRRFQQIWWRKNPTDPLSVYQLNTVTYGTASAPFLAIRSLKQLAMDELDNFPEASQSLIDDFYVDDFSSGANGVEEARRLKIGITSLLAKAGFDLTKWASNNREVVPDQKEFVVGILGIKWNCQSDTVNISLIGNDAKGIFRKRTVLSIISQIFDPMGLCGPVVFIAKVFMQKLWAIPDLQWDDELPDPFKSEWMDFYNQLKHLGTVNVPRCIWNLDQIKTVELHGFGDASQIGYGCCIYIRTIYQNNQYRVCLLCAKSRVARLKTQTIPRLELCAALLLSQLYERVRESMKIKFDKVTLWSDSEITLFRIRSSPSKYATFVANRVSQIQDLNPPEYWAYVPSEQNPADIISRGLMPSELMNSDLWWNGPPSLLQNDRDWSIPKIDAREPHLEDVECLKSTSMLVGLEAANCFVELFSNYNKLIRIAALCLRFVRNMKLTAQNRRFEALSPQEIDNGLMGIIKFIQGQSYAQEIKQLRSIKLVHKQSSISKLYPFLDAGDILRVGGRLEKSDLSYDQKYPILLPSNNTFTFLLVQKEHVRNLHCGPQALHCTLRQRFWIIGGRGLCRKVVHNCILCFRTRPRSVEQLMGQLPAERVQCSRAFQNVGIDFCGPFAVTHKIRCKVTSKAYIAVFICFATKATHLEVVSDLTTNGFVAALRRFVSRRGRPSNIFGDNATNFVGSQAELRELQRLFQTELHNHEVLRFCVEEGMQWNTIPPRSPHFGGLWEAAVKSAKFHLKRILSYQCTFEELNTLIIQIEGCLNSRPLTPISSDPSDLTALTPGHFLVGCPLNSLPEPTLLHLDFNRLARYQRLQYSLQQFWQRWTKEYLGELQQRTKWTRHTSNVQVGCLVLLKEDNLPPMKWVMGRVVKVHVGSDGFVRVVTVRTSTGEFKRAIVKICVLPVDTNKEGEVSLGTVMSH